MQVVGVREQVRQEAEQGVQDGGGDVGEVVFGHDAMHWLLYRYKGRVHAVQLSTATLHAVQLVLHNTAVPLILT